MLIITLVRQVLDAEESVRVRGGAVDLEGSKLVMDTMDEYGVEEALRLREAAPGETPVEIVALAIGPERAEESLRTALAMGADRGVHVLTNELLDAIALSAVVAQVARGEGADLIFCGGQQADWDSQALGAATAERLQWPQATWTSQLERKGSTLVGKHEVDEGSETFEIEWPAVVTTQQGLNEPRYPTLPNIMKSKKKEIRRQPLEAFGIAPRLKVLGSEIQVKERKRKILDGKDASAAAAQLVKMLREEAGVVA